MGLLNNIPVRVTAQAGNLPQLIDFGNGAAFNGGTLWKRNVVTQAAAMDVDLSLGNWISITLTTGAAYGLTAANWGGVALSATNIPIGMSLLITILNLSGGAAGAFSMSGVWKGAAGFTAPANGSGSFAPMIVLSSTQIIAAGTWGTGGL